MKLQVLAIFDSATKVFSHPHFDVTVERAQGSFEVTCKDPRTNLSKYPKDYSLWHLAEYDDSTGRFENLKAPLMVVSAMSYANLSKPVAEVQQ